MIAPHLAAVRPRVVVPREGTCLVEDEVASRLASERWGVIYLHGPLGSGKTSALEHLEQLFLGDSRLLLCEDLTDVYEHQSRSKLVICTFLLTLQTYERWEMARWTRDDCIEYLLNLHPRQCASVVARIHEPEVDLGGIAELWSGVLDQLAADESLTDFRTALRRELIQRIASPAGLPIAREGCLRITCRPSTEGTTLSDWQKDRRIGSAAVRWLRHEPVRLLAAADAWHEILHSGIDWCSEKDRYPHELIAEMSPLLENDSHVIEYLKGIVDRGRSLRQPTAVSLLHAAGENCLPLKYKPLLTGARLCGTNWRGADLNMASLQGVDFSDADLSEAILTKADAAKAIFHHADLHGAQLTSLDADRAILMQADLSYARARHASFNCANLVAARLEGALLRDCDFRFADLRKSTFVRANLIGAKFEFAELAGADFMAADLSASHMRQLTLHEANFVGACFDDADLERCNFEGMVLPGASFQGANLRQAILTGTRIPDGNFRDADLSNTALAEIDWEGADLRDTNLRRCTFHFGSSRSGLVGSPIACEGSRTGFYTDELEEQDFKSPEEIRKANLRGADLRGADITHTDFYLVDLRDAKYSPDQEEHFRRTGAILKARV